MKKRKGISLKLRFTILERDGFSCCACGFSAAGGARLEIDHIKPIVAGGTNDESNLQSLCFECNRGKGIRMMRSIDKAIEV